MTIEDIETLSSALKLEEYDALLIGDGSGTVAATPSAWSCWRYLKASKKLELHHGASTFGTNQFAELMPYLGVLWLDHYEKHARPRRIQIVSDSEVTVKCGNKDYGKSANLILWNMLDFLSDEGYLIKWKHVNRNTNDFNAACDRYAGNLRRQIKEFGLTANKESGIM